MNLARAVQISGDGGQDGRHLEKKHRGRIISAARGALAESHATTNARDIADTQPRDPWGERPNTAVQLEEVKGLLAQERLDSERWQGKCGVLKDEYYTLKAETASRSTELEARLSQSSKQLEHYEMIEAEL